MLGVALGVIGLSLSDFDALTPLEFEQICLAYEDNKLNEYQATHRNAWERMRFLALYFLLPYSKKNLTARDIAVFEWEKKGSLDKSGEIKKKNSKAAFLNAIKRFQSSNV